jgi:hypothetical protein
LLSRKNNRQPETKVDRYYLAEGSHRAAGYRLLWIRSTQKAEQDAQTRDRHLAKTLEGLKGVQSRLNTYRLKSHQGSTSKKSYRNITLKTGLNTRSTPAASPSNTFPTGRPRPAEAS